MLSFSKVIKIIGIIFAIRSLLHEKSESKNNPEKSKKRCNPYPFIIGSGIGIAIIIAVLAVLIPIHNRSINN